MNKTLITSSLALAAAFGVFALSKLGAADSASFQVHEYAMIRWSGRENSALIRPNGSIEPLGPLFARSNRPEKMDDRSFYMTIAINAVAREGFEVVAFTRDEVIMRRHPTR